MNDPSNIISEDTLNKGQTPLSTDAQQAWLESQQD